MSMLVVRGLLLYQLLRLIMSTHNNIKLAGRLIAFHVALRQHSAESPHLRGVEEHWEQDSYPTILYKFVAIPGFQASSEFFSLLSVGKKFLLR